MCAKNATPVRPPQVIDSRREAPVASPFSDSQPHQLQKSVPTIVRQARDGLGGKEEPAGVRVLEAGHPNAGHLPVPDVVGVYAVVAQILERQPIAAGIAAGGAHVREHHTAAAASSGGGGGL